MTRALPTNEQIERVLEFLPRLEAHEGSFEIEPPETPEGVWILDVNYAPVVGELIRALYENGFVLDFDWSGWEEGRKRGDDRSWILRADLETLCKLFTAHARSDRFCSGHFGQVCEDGLVLVMLKRLKELRETR